MQQIKISESHAYYGDLHVLNNVSLSIDKGEIISIIGPSGSGKSSLLKLLVGLLLPKSGTISISNKIIDYTNKAHLNYARNKTAIVFQQYNLFENIKIKNFSVLPGSEEKLLKGLKLGCSGIITATCNVTAPLARKVYEDFLNNKEQTHNEKLCAVRKAFKEFNLISGLHTFLAQKEKNFKNILPTLSLLNENDKKKLFENLNKLNFILTKSGAT